MVSTRLPILVWEDGLRKGQHSASWEWPRHWDKDWNWSNFLLFFNAIRLLLSIKLPWRREKKMHLVFLKYVLYLFLYAFRVGKDRVMRGTTFSFGLTFILPSQQTYILFQSSHSSFFRIFLLVHLFHNINIRENPGKVLNFPMQRPACRC